MGSWSCTIFFAPVIVKYMEKNLDITKSRYTDHIFPVPWPFVKSRFHCMSLCNSLIEQRPKTNLWWTRSIFCLPFSLNKMFVRKSNNKVHVIFKYTKENIKVSTFAANGKRQFVPRDCSLLLHKKNQKFHYSFTNKKCFRLFLHAYCPFLEFF